MGEGLVKKAERKSGENTENEVLCVGTNKQIGATGALNNKC